MPDRTLLRGDRTAQLQPRASVLLYVDLEPHPGGADYFLLEEILQLRTCLGFRCSRGERGCERFVGAALCSPSLVGPKSMPSGLCSGLCACVGVMLTNFLDGAMMYDVCEGQGRQYSRL